MRVKPTKPCVAFRANDKKSHALIQKIETLEIEIGTVHDIKGTRLWVSKKTIPNDVIEGLRKEYYHGSESR